MDQRTASLRSSDPAYWDVLTTLVRLYEEGSQKDLANGKLNLMQEFLAARPDPIRADQLEKLRNAVATNGR